MWHKAGMRDEIVTINMSYCRWENTLKALRECDDAMWDEDLSNEEERARKHLIRLCRRMANDAEQSFEDE